MDDLVNDFLVESHENLDDLERQLLHLETAPNASGSLGGIFRAIHTIKGTCGFLGFGRLEKVTHAGESLLAKLRDGTLSVDAEIASALLSMVDAVRAMLSEIETTKSDGSEGYAELIALLTRLQEPPSAPAPAAAPPPPARAREPARDSAVAESTLRVDVQLLDKLMNLVGELVLARNQILQLLPSTREGALEATTQRLSRITTELQEGVMKTRMQPIRNVWSKFPRLVRDLSGALEKRVRIEMEGEDTDLDKTILEAIKDPLTHILRNAIDHGIEAPELRRARGKPEEGRLHLRAFHEGGQVNLEVHDDGGGLDLARIRAKAVEKGLMSAEQAARMGEREVANLVFTPGFSTAAHVTNVSGRGVGMDVVRINIERIGGSVDLHAVPGQGTSVRIKIPLTLAIIPALMVRSGGSRFAIPQVSLLELVRLEGEAARSGIERIHGAPVHRLRGSLLPLVSLAAELAQEGPGEPPEAVNIVVLQADQRSFGLIVDEIEDTQEIVVKPLGRQLKGLSIFAGATILGDGRVALILDVNGLARGAQVVTKGRERVHSEEGARASGNARARQTLLLAQVGGSARVGIPLGSVARLEEVPASAVERAGSQEVVQYRGRIVPLVRLAAALGLETGQRPHGERLEIVVHGEGERTVAWVVDRIVDVLEEEAVLQAQGARPGVRGRAVVQGRVTEVVDLGELWEASCARSAAAPVR